MAASLDVLSGGRLTLGVGAGWLKEEFEALNSPAFNARGAVTDEWIAIFKQLWSQSPASFNDRFYRYSDIRCEPFPVQKPHPPIWVGGIPAPPCDARPGMAMAGTRSALSPPHRCRRKRCARISTPNSSKS
jgi:alkanesulfonate monooxygenase SsuD/methylene tetrahydromethanopterin reductase-like flavin-dependent oxidoreductase (luciferase family)